MEKYYNETLDRLYNEKSDSKRKLRLTLIKFGSTLLATVGFALIGKMSLENIIDVAPNLALPLGIITSVCVLIPAGLTIHSGFELNSIRKNIDSTNEEISYIERNYDYTESRTDDNSLYDEVIIRDSSCRGNTDSTYRVNQTGLCDTFRELGVKEATDADLTPGAKAYIRQRTNH